MSVWKTPCYRDDAFQNVAPFCHVAKLNCPFIQGLLDFDIPNPGNFRLPCDLREGVCKVQLAGNVDRIAEFRHMGERKLRNATTRLLVALPECKFGLHAVQHFAATFWNMISAPAQNRVTDDIAYLYREAYLLGDAGGYMTPRTSKEDARRSWNLLAEASEGTREFLREVYRHIKYAHSKIHQRQVLQAEKQGKMLPHVFVTDLVKMPEFQLWQIGSNTLVMHRSSVIPLPNGNYKFTGGGYFFTRNDITRLEQLLRGIGNLHFYYRSYCWNQPDLCTKVGRAGIRMLEHLLDSFRNANPRTANLVCRAYDVAYSMYLARLASDINDIAVTAQNAKWEREGLDVVTKSDSILRIADGLKPKEALEVLLAYKVCPQPDFDYMGAMERQRVLYQGGPGYRADVNGVGSYDDILRYFTWTLARSFHSRHGQMPGKVRDGVLLTGWRAAYPRVHPSRVPFQEINDIDMHGAFVGRYRKTDILDLVKDKAICPAGVGAITTEREYIQLPVKKRNQLCDVLLSGRRINIQDLRGDWNTLVKDVKLDDKAEAKKPNQRMFMLAHTDVRLIHSEREANVAAYAREVRGCMAGVRPRDRIKAINEIVAEDSALESGGFRKVLVSFDLDKFSPYFDARIHRDLDAILADLFGQADWASDWDIFSEGRCHYIKRGVHHVMNKPGRDFEGFSGRTNTIYHCAVMGYAVHKIRTNHITDKGARLASLIDDGLLRLDLPAKDYKARVQDALSIIERIYTMAGMKISWDKTYVSEHVCVFLNDVRYYGTSIRPGARAFLKISNMCDQPAPTIVAEHTYAEATARGARMAGAYVASCWAMYVRCCVDSVVKFNQGQVPVSGRFAVRLFVPIAYGGFGMCNSAILDAAARNDPVVDGIGTLRQIAFQHRTYVTVINRILNQKLRSKRFLDKLRAPNTFRRVGRTLRASRYQEVVESAVVSQVSSIVIEQLLGAARLYSAEQVASVYVRQGRVVAEVASLIWASCSEHAVEIIANKFLRSATAISLIGFRAILRLSAANFTEARALIRE